MRAYLESSNNMHKLNYMNEDKFFGYNTGTVIITITVTPRDIGNIVNANFEAKKLRTEMYRGIADAITSGDSDLGHTGRALILPSTFVGGPRYMANLFQDCT